MMDCICSIIDSAFQNEMLRSASLQALENTKKLTNCNVKECFEELEVPYSSSGGVPLEFFVFPAIAIGLLLTRPKSLQKK